MKINDLNREQKIQLKTNILVEKNENVSYCELSNADELVTDDELEEKFGSTFFVPDDFAY